MIDKLKIILKNKATRNAGWLIGGNVAYKLIAFLVGIWTARYLGPGNYGLIDYASAYTTFFFSLCTLGINSVIVKNFIDHPEEEGETLGTSLCLQCLSGFLSVAMITLIVYFVDYGETITILVVFLCSLGLFFQVMDGFKYWFQSKLMSKYAAIATTVAYIISSAYKIVLLITGKSVLWFALATSVDYLAAAIILYACYRKNKGPKLRFSTKKAKELLKSSYHYILSGLMVAIYGATDKLMLKYFLDEAAVGYYGTALNICNVWVFVLSAIIDSMNPIIMESHNTDRVKYEKTNRLLYAMVFYISVSVSACICIFAKFGVNLLYGEKYLPAVLPLRIATWYVAFSFLGVARNAWVVCENKQKYLTPLYAGSALLNVVLNSILIPKSGVEGAALATLITQVGTIFLFPVLIKDMRPNVKLMVEGIGLWKLR